MLGVEIQVVQNGYIVTEPVGPNCAANISGAHVFEDFDSLMSWLKANMTTPPDHKAPEKKK